MSFYSQIEPYIEYLHSIRKLQDYLIFDIKFPSKWLIPKSMSEDGNLVPFNVDTDELRGVSFVSSINELNITSTIDKIQKVISLNKERELKERLFKEYVNKLKNTFETNNLDKLKNLHFEFDDNNIKLNEHETGDKPETIKVVGPRENERQSTGENIQEQTDKRNKRVKKGELIPET
jgi:WD40 repeat protein